MPGSFGVQPVEHQSEPVGPDPVAERRDRRVGRMRHGSPVAHADRRVVGEPDQVERARRGRGAATGARPGTRNTPSRNKSRPGCPEDRVEPLDRAAGLRRRRPAARSAQSAKIDATGAPVCLRRSAASAVARCIASVDDGDFVAVVVAGRKAAAAVRGERVEVRLVHRLPPADEIAERLGHAVDVARPGVGAILRRRGSRRRRRTSAAA